MATVVDESASSPQSATFAATSSSLLIRLRASDQSAWDQFVALYGPLVYFWCRQRGLQAADASDVGQEVFRAVARKIHDFHRDRPGAFHAWLRTIARNKIFDFFRQRAGQADCAGGSDAYRELLAAPASSESETDESVSLNDEADLKQEQGLLFQRAAELIRSSFEERTWQAFWRTAVEHQSPKHVAADLKISLNAVYLAKSKILRRLRDEFGDLVEI